MSNFFISDALELKKEHLCPSVCFIAYHNQCISNGIVYVVFGPIVTVLQKCTVSHVNERAKKSGVYVELANLIFRKLYAIARHYASHGPLCTAL